MNILVFTKRVPATQEEELRIIKEGQEVDLSKVQFKVNDWDNYAVEEAVRIVEKAGGTVTAISMGDSESDEVLRRAMAMGAQEGILLKADKVLHDPSARSTLMGNFIKKEGMTYDVIFTGVQSEDDQFASLGGLMAAQFGLPFASMVVGIDAFEAHHVVVRRELEGGLQERIKMALPCVLSIQSGINEPRYVSIMGIRKASKVERKVFKAETYMENLKSRIELVKWTYPEKKGGATMLSGEMEDICRKVIDILKEKGVCK